MAVVWNTTMTNLGLQLQTKQVQGATIAFTRAVSGSGSVPVVNLREQTAVSQIQQTLSMQGLTMGDLQYTIKLLLTNLNLNSGYNLSQVGLYATDPDLGEILFAIAQLSDTKPIPSKTDAPGYSLLMSLTFQNDQGANIEITPDMSGYVSMSAAQDMIDDATDPIIESLADKVDKVAGKGLSTNDFTNEDKNKLAGIEAGAQVNVQADYTQNDSTKDDYIKNKPTLGTAAAKDSTNAVTDDSTNLVESGAVFDNIQDVYEVMGKNGAKNLLPMTLDDIKVINTSGTWSGNAYTVNGVTFTILTDSDGNVTGIKANGTANSNVVLYLKSSLEGNKYNNQILSGCDNNGSDSTYYLGFGEANSPYLEFKDTGDGITIQNIEEGRNSFRIYIFIYNNTNMNNKTFYPMIRLASDTDPTFQPYAKTNLQLTKEVEGAKTATGNPITLTDAAPVNAVNVSMDLEPAQDLHGYDHPWVGGAGKNKLPLTVDGIKALNTSGSWSGNVYTYNGVTFTILTDLNNNVTGIKANGTASSDSLFRLYLATNIFNTMNLCGCPSGGDSSTYHIAVQLNQSPWTTSYDNGSGTTITIENDVGIYIFIRIKSRYNANNILFKPMVSTDTTITYNDFSPYSNICPISGRSEVAINRVGKNLFDKNNVITNKVPNTSGGLSNQNGTDTTEHILKLEPSTTYTISGNLRIRFWTYDKDGNYLDTFLQDAGQFTTTAQTYGLRISGNSGWQSANIQIEKGSQPTNYQPYTGKTYRVEIGQKNKVEDTLTGANIGSNGQIGSDSNYDLAIAKVKSGVTYTITTDDSAGFVGGFFTNKPTPQATSYNNSRIVTANKTFTAPIDGYVAFRTNTGYTTPQCEQGSQATPYVPYNPNLPSAIYGGELDVTRGKMVVDKGYAEFDGSSDEDWSVSNNSFVGSLPSATLSDNTNVNMSFCNAYEGKNMNTLYANRGTVGWTGVAGASTGVYVVDNVTFPSTKDATAWRTYLASNPLQVVYPLATPITIQLTPQQIKMLENTNTIYTDYEGDTITIEYQPNNAIGEAVRAVEESYDAELEYLKPTGSISSGDTKAVTGGVVYDYHNTTPLNPKDDLYIEKSGNVINIEARDVDGSAFTSYPGAGGYTLPTGYIPKRMLIVCVYVYTTYDNKKHHGFIKIRDDGTMDGYFIDFSGNEHRIYDPSYRSEVSFNTSYIV